MINSEQDLNYLDFVVVGGAKSGTTTLYSLLKGAQSLRVPDKKDFHFFDYDENYHKGFDWYKSNFPDKDSGMVTGEVAANYLYLEAARDRVISSNVNIKVIILLRDPVQRTISEYKHHFRNGSLKNTLDYYISNPDAPIEGNLRYNPWHILVERSKYSHWINMWAEKVDKNNILLLDISELNDIGCLQTSLSKFLCLEKLYLKNVQRENEAFIPKSLFVSQLLKGDSGMKRLLRKLVPSFKFRKVIKDVVKSINRSSNNSVSSMVIEGVLLEKISHLLEKEIEFYEAFKKDC